MRAWLFLPVLLAASASAQPGVSASTAPVRLTLPGVVQQALAQAVTVLKAGNADQAQGARLLQAYAQFLPDLSAVGGYNQLHGVQFLTEGPPTVVDSRNRGYDYELSSTLNLFNGLSDYGSFQAALGQRRAAVLSLERARQQVALDIAQAYLQVKLDERIMSYAAENFEASQQRQTLLEQETEVGSRGLPDLYRQQAQTSADLSFLIDTRNKRRDDLLALLRRARYDMSRDYELADVALDTADAGRPYEDEAGLVAAALGARPDLRATLYLADAAEAGIASARSGYLPRVDLGWTMENTSRLFDTDDVNGVAMVPASQPSFDYQFSHYTNYVVGLTATWRLFDRLSTHAAVRQAQAAASDAELDYEDARLGVQQDVKQAFGDFQAAELKLTAAHEGLRSARESYEATAQRYEVQASSLLDLQTAQSALLQAQAALAQAEIGLYLEGRQMEFALGRMPAVAPGS